MSQLLSFPSTPSPDHADAPYAALIDRWLPVLDQYELRCLLYIVRHTAGRGKAQDAIALSQFSRGIVRSDSIPQDGGTGLDPRGVRRGLAGLERRGLISIRRAKLPGTQANATNIYSLEPDPDAALLTALDAVLAQADPWAESAPTSADTTGAIQVVELGAHLHQTDQDQEKKDRKKENACVQESIAPEGEVSPQTPPLIPVSSNPSLEVWWLSAVAAHNGQHPRPRLTDTDAGTLARWRSLGVPDPTIRAILTRLLAEDVQGRIYALAYCHHAVMTAAGSAAPKTKLAGRAEFRREHGSAAQSSRWHHHRQNTPPLMAEHFLSLEYGGRSPLPSAPPPAAPEFIVPTPPTTEPETVPPVASPVTAHVPHAAETAHQITCSKCWRSFTSADDDPCLRALPPYDRRTWSATHIARYHRPARPASGAGLPSGSTA